jgi:hypothetical protein
MIDSSNEGEDQDFIVPVRLPSKYSSACGRNYENNSITAHVEDDIFICKRQSYSKLFCHEEIMKTKRIALASSRNSDLNMEAAGDY